MSTQLYACGCTKHSPPWKSSAVTVLTVKCNKCRYAYALNINAAVVRYEERLVGTKIVRLVFNARVT